MDYGFSYFTNLILKQLGSISNDQLYFKFIYITRHYCLYTFHTSQTMQNTNCILKTLNNCVFNNTAQIFLSNLEYQDLEQLLKAIQNLVGYQELSQLVRARIIVLLSEKNDRTLYYTYFDIISVAQLKQQRVNLLSETYSKKELKFLLQSFGSLIRKGLSIYGEQFVQIKQSILEPSLALLPMRREIIAPNCQTVYQITLAFQKLNSTMQQENIFSLNDQTPEFFEQCLNFQIEMAYYNINSLIDDLQHFVELTYRFMVYRNTVLSLHSICPFSDITTTMSKWTSRMESQYLRANQVYLKLLGIQNMQQHKFGLFNFEELKQEGYMLDYVQSLVDQTVTQQDVLFCGHSKQNLRGLYTILQNSIVQWVKMNKCYIQTTIDLQQIQNTLQNWLLHGVKPSTLSKVVDIFNDFMNDTELNKQLCNQDDCYIENCAKINGISLPNPNQISTQC